MSGATELPTLDGLPGSIQAMGADLGGVAGAAEHTTVVAHGPGAVAVSSKWGPAIHAARSAEIGTLAGRVKHAATALRMIDKALTTFGDDLARINRAIGELQKDWDEVDAFYARERQTIHDDPYAPRTTEAAERQRAADLAKVDGFQQADHARLKSAWDKLCVQANNDANATAKSVTTALNGFVPAASRGSAQGIATSITQGMPLAGDYEKWKYAQVDANRAAGMLASFEQGDLNALKDFNQQFGNRLKDPTFQLALSKALGAQGYTDFMNAMASHRAFHGVTPDMQKAFVLLSASLATSIGGTPKGTALGGVGSAVYREGLTQWLKDLAAQGPRVSHLHNDVGSADTNSTTMTGYWAQGQLLLFAHDGLGQTGGGEYFRTVGRDLLAFDASHQGTGLRYAQYFTSPIGSAIPFWDPSAYPNVHYAGSGGAHYQPGSADPDRLNDPVMDLLVASSGSEDAATSYLTSVVHGSGTSGMRGVTYLVQHRGASQADQGLLAQIVDQWGRNHSHTPAGYQSTTMAHDYLEAYARTVSDGHYTPVGDGTAHANLPDNAFKDARGPAADLLANNMDRLENANNGVNSSDAQAVDEISPTAGHPGSYGVNFGTMLPALPGLYKDIALDRPEDLVHFVADPQNPDHAVGAGNLANPPAIQRLLAAQRAYDQQHYQQLMSTHGDLKGAALNASTLSRTIANSANDAWNSQAAAQDAFRDFLLNTGKAAVDQVPVAATVGSIGGPVGTIGGFAVGQAWSQGTHRVIDAWANHAWPKATTTADHWDDIVNQYVSESGTQNVYDAALMSHRIVAPAAHNFLQTHPSIPHSEWFTTPNGDIDWTKISPTINGHTNPAYNDNAHRHFVEFRDHDLQGSISDALIAVAAGSH